MEEPAEESAFSKLPTRLQESFFELAEEAASRLSKILRLEEMRLRDLKKFMKFRKVPSKDLKDIRVGVVDGSISPRLSERMGFRIGVYTASYMVFDGDAIISDEDEESMEAGYIMAPQTGSSLHTKKILSLLCTLLERELALKCMKKYGVDLMLIDGSFYGFRARCSEIKEKKLSDLGIEGIGGRESGMKSGWDLIKEVYDKSRKLRRSGKALGVIKRIRTAAIDGWLLSRRWSIQDVLNKNDRVILRSLMKVGEYFDYIDLLGNERSYLHYSGLKGWFNEIRKKLEKVSDSEKLNKALEHVDNKLRLQIITDLCRKNASEEEKDEVFNEVISTRRFYVKLSPHAPPACIELGSGLDLDFVLSYLKSCINPATGLPFPLDLIDENISVDRRLAIEFADEIESRLFLNPELNADHTYGEFESINPQKLE